MPHATRCPAPECGVMLAANGMDAARTLTLLLTTPRFMSVTAGSFTAWCRAMARKSPRGCISIRCKACYCSLCPARCLYKVRCPHCAEEEPERFIILPNKSINKKRREPNHAAFLIVNADDKYRIVPIIRNQAISLNTLSRGTSGCRYRPFRPQWPG